MKFSSTLPFAAGVSAGTVLWDGRFNSYASSADLTEWSWSNQVGEYQYYIHGSGEVTEYVNLSEDYKNPADTASDQGVKISLTDTAYWNGQTMRRTELIPQTTAAIGAGKVYYHFSMKRSDVNPPAETREHQIAFFESHFTEMKAGWMSGASGTSDASLRWFANSQSQWNVTWEADVWHNVAYEIDFDAGTVGFWHSTGADALTQVVAPVTASTSSNGADWHLGVLELPRDGYTDAVEDIYFSGVYVESGDLTTEIGSGSGSSSGSSSIAAAPAATSVAATSAQASTVASPTTLQTSTVAASIATSAASSPATSASTSAVTTAVAETTAIAPVETTPVPVATSSATTSSAAAATKSAKTKCNKKRHARK